MYSLGFRNLTDGALNYLWLNELLQVWPKEKLAQPMVCNLVARVPSKYRQMEGIEKLSLREVLDPITILFLYLNMPECKV